MLMKKISLVTLSAICLVTLATLPSVNAIPITGSISFDGGPITTDTGNLFDANAIASFGSMTTSSVTPGSGSYAGIPFSTAVTTTNGFTFNPNLSPNPVLVWSFDFGGLTYSFNLSNITFVDQGTDMFGNQFLTILGTGLLGITGYEDTFGDYVLTANETMGVFSFSAGNSALGQAVPEGGTTIVMLGGVLVAFGAIRRRMHA
jgi:hypothetical protein